MARMVEGTNPKDKPRKVRYNAPSHPYQKGFPVGAKTNKLFDDRVHRCLNLEALTGVDDDGIPAP